MFSRIEDAEERQDGRGPDGSPGLSARRSGRERSGRRPSTGTLRCLWLEDCLETSGETQQALLFVVHVFFVQVPLAVDAVAAVFRDSAVMSRTCSGGGSDKLRRKRHVSFRKCDASDTHSASISATHPTRAGAGSGRLKKFVTDSTSRTTLAMQAGKNPAQMDLQKQKRDFRFSLWFNTGLDVLYMVAGVLMMTVWGNQLAGHGAGILVQGGFLFVFDLVNALITYRY